MLNLTEEMLNGELTTVWYQLGEYIPPKRFRFSLYNVFLLTKAKGGTISGAEWDEEKGQWESKEANLEYLFDNEDEAHISYYSQCKEMCLRMKAHHQSNANHEASKVNEFDKLLNELSIKLEAYSRVATTKGDAI